MIETKTKASFLYLYNTFSFIGTNIHSITTQNVFVLYNISNFVDDYKCRIVQNDRLSCVCCTQMCDVLYDERETCARSVRRVRDPDESSSGQNGAWQRVRK